jgi:hypothetical protein
VGAVAVVIGGLGGFLGLMISVFTDQKTEAFQRLDYAFKARDLDETSEEDQSRETQAGAQKSRTDKNTERQPSAPGSDEATVFAAADPVLPEGGPVGKQDTRSTVTRTTPPLFVADFVQVVDSGRPVFHQVDTAVPAAMPIGEGDDQGCLEEEPGTRSLDELIHVVDSESVRQLPGDRRAVLSGTAPSTNGSHSSR